MTLSCAHSNQLQERLRKIGEVGGLKELGVLNEDALDDEWDPAKHEVWLALYCVCPFLR